MLGLVVVLLVVLAAFLPALRGQFLSYDDDGYVTANADVAHPGLARILDPSNRVIGDWTPLATLSFVAERALLGTSPVVPHATNVLLHLAAVVLVQRLLRACGFRPAESLLAALLFGVHPLHVESVAWISSRKGLLAAVAGFAFLRSHVAGRPVAATAWLVLALLSKGTAVGFVPAAAAASWLGLAPGTGRARWGWFVAWGALAVARGAISIDAQATVVARAQTASFAPRMATMGVVLARQAWQVIVPAGLSPVYVLAGRSWADAEVLASWAAVAAIVVVAVRAARRDASVAFAGALALACLLPTLNIVPAPLFQADRYLQFALAGIAALAVAATRPLARVRRFAPHAVVAAWCLAVAVPVTVGRIAVWRTNETLWRDVCESRPDVGLGWTQLGAEYLAQDRPDEAIACLERAATLPNNVESARLTNLALALRRVGRVAEARAAAERAVATPPETAAAHGAYGVLLAETGDAEGAEREFAASVRLAPNWAQVHVYRAEMLLRRGDVAGARAEATRATEKPGGSVMAVVVLAAADAVDGRLDAGFERFRAVLPPGTRATEIWSGIGDRLLDVGHPGVAERAYLRAAAADPDNAMLRYLVAVCREAAGDTIGASDAAREAVARAAPGARWLPDAVRLAGR